jgi:prepilin-type N-terminal cleavage/methylation domain-containing protein
MKTLCLIKIIQNFRPKNHDHGFTLIELLVFIMIVGILVSIGLPSFLNNACGMIRNRSREGRVYVNLMSADQMNFISKKGKFANSLEELKPTLPSQTDNYSYYTKSTSNAAFIYGIARVEYIQKNWFNKQPIKSVVSGVFKMPTDNLTKINTMKILCINDKPGNIIPPQPIFKNGVLTCGLGTTEFR